MCIRDRRYHSAKPPTIYRNTGNYTSSVPAVHWLTQTRGLVSSFHRRPRQSWSKERSLIYIYADASSAMFQLEYLAVYGRASSEQCARGASALNTWSKVWPWILTWAYLIWNFWTHIWSTNINFRPPPLTLDFLVHLGLNFHPMSELRGGSVGPATYFFCHGRTETWLLKVAPRSVREARVKI